MNQDKSKPIGILGGTFDPIHFGHLRTALEVSQILDLKEVRLIPCKIPVHKQNAHATSSQRVSMIQLAIADQPELICDTREIERESPSYMVETLQSLKKDFPSNPLCLILGTDTFNELDTWQDWQKITQFAHVIVVLRGGSAFVPHQEVEQLLNERKLDDPAGLYENSAGSIYVQNITQLEISATTIRGQLQAGYSPRYLLPEAVLDYIKQHNIYNT